jgi:hypothetical protein
MMGVGCDIRPDCSNQDGPTLTGLLREELSASVLERADQGHRQDAGLAVGERLASLVRLGIVKKQGQAFPVAVGAVGFDLLQLGTAVPDLPHRDGSIAGGDAVSPAARAGSVGERQLMMPATM